MTHVLAMATIITAKSYHHRYMCMCLSQFLCIALCVLRVGILSSYSFVKGMDIQVCVSADWRLALYWTIKACNRSDSMWASEKRKVAWNEWDGGGREGGKGEGECRSSENGSEQYEREDMIMSISTRIYSTMRTKGVIILTWSLLCNNRYDQMASINLAINRVWNGYKQPWTVLAISYLR